MQQLKKFIPFIVIWLLAVSNTICQTKQTDSLLTLLKTSTNPNGKIDLLNSLFFAYEFTDPTKAKSFLDEALVISKKSNLKDKEAEIYKNTGYYFEDIGQLNEALTFHVKALKIREELNDKKGLGSSYNNIGVIHFNLGNYGLALNNYKKSISINKKLKDEKGLGITYNAMGNLFTVQGNYSESIKYFLQFLKIAEKNNNKSNMASAYNNIGISYEHQSKYKEALKNFAKSLEISNLLNDKMAISRTLNNLANIYFKQKKYQKSLEIHLKALKMDMEIGDKKNIANSLTNIGNIYSEEAELEPSNEIKRDKFTQSLTNHLKSLEIRKTLGDKNGIATSEYNIGNTYLKQKKYEPALLHLSNANGMALSLGQKELIKNSYGALYELYTANDQYKKAYETYKLHIIYKDSLINEESHKKIIQEQMTYEFEKKEAVAKVEHKKELENQQLIANEKNRKQRLIIGFVFGGLIVVVLFAIFIFRSLRKTKKQKQIIEQQKNIAEKQKMEIELQRDIVEEKQKEIMDSIRYAKRIQMALMPNNKMIEKILRNKNQYK